MADGYAGDISPKEAWAMLENEPDAVLVDVRTGAEWSFVGVPDLSGIGKAPVLDSWVLFPRMERNPDFVATVEKAVANPQSAILFLCRSGVRSRAAAVTMTERGYGRCYNIRHGFEGDMDGERHRNTVGGWRHDDLPWTQS